jgi:hypothetical protein
MGMTQVVLAEVNEDLLRGALHTACKLRTEANKKSSTKRPVRANSKRVSK